MAALVTRDALFANDATTYDADFASFEGRQELDHRLSSRFSLSNAFRVSAGGTTGWTRDYATGYSGDRKRFDIDVEAHTVPWGWFSFGANASRNRYRRVNDVTTDVQDAALAWEIEPRPGVRLSDSIGAFWSRTTDVRVSDSTSDNVVQDSGIEHVFAASIVEDVGEGTQIDGRFSMENQPWANFPSSSVTGGATVDHARENLDVSVDLNHRRTTNSFYSDILRRHERKKKYSEGVSSEMRKWALDRSLETRVRLDMSRTSIRYDEQPKNNQGEDRSDIAGMVRYAPTDRLEVEVNIGRGFDNYRSSLLEGGVLDELTERRSVDAIVMVAPLDWVRLDLRGDQILYRSDYVSDPTGDDNDRLESSAGLTAWLTRWSWAEFSLDMSLDRFEERHLRATQALRNYVTTSYRLGPRVDYTILDSLRIRHHLLLSSSYTDLAFDRARSTVFLERRFTTDFTWERDRLELDVFGEAKQRTNGALAETGSGERGIVISSRENIGVLDTTGWLRWNPDMRVGGGWRGQVFSRTGRSMEQLHDLSMDFSCDLESGGAIDMALTRNIRKDIPSQTTFNLSVHWIF